MDETSTTGDTAVSRAETPTTADSPETPHDQDEKPKKWKPSRAARVVREVAAVLFWAYMLFKPFVFEIDRWLVSAVAPNAAWIVEWRSVILLLTLAVMFIVLRPKRLAWWLLWILFYPLVIAFWRIPMLLFQLKSWTLGLAAVATTLSMIRSARLTVPVASAIIAGLIMAVFALRDAALVLSIVLLVAGTIAVYVRLILRAFIPSKSPFSSESFSRAVEYIKKNFASEQSADDSSKPKVVVPEDQRQTQLEVSVLYSKACYFAASKFGELKSSSLNIAAAFLQVIALYLLSAATFGMSAYALYKIDPVNYAIEGSASAFDFFYFGFKSLYGAGVYGLEPVSVSARTLDMLTLGTGGLVVMVVVVNVLLIVRERRRGRELTGLAETLATHGQQMEAFIDEHFGVSVELAIQEMFKAGSGFIGALNYLAPETKPHDA